MGKVFGSFEYVNYSYHTLKITDASRSAVFRIERKQQGIRGGIFKVAKLPLLDQHHGCKKKLVLDSFLVGFNL